MTRTRSPRLVVVGTLALALSAAIAGAARAGGPHGPRWGVALDPGVGPYRGAYDAAIPGWNPGPECGRHGHDAGPPFAWLNLNSHSPHVRTGLYRYPFLGIGGYVPAGPHDDLLYRTGRSPLKR